MLCFISATSQTIPPSFVFPSVKAPESIHWDELPEFIGFDHCSRWITSENFLCSMEHFLKEVQLSKKDPVLLLFDNYERQTSEEVVSLCKDNNIHHLTFPLHRSYHLQPLDISLHAPSKYAIRESFGNWMQLNPFQEISIAYMK